MLPFISHYVSDGTDLIRVDSDQMLQFIASEDNAGVTYIECGGADDLSLDVMDQLIAIRSAVVSQENK